MGKRVPQALNQDSFAVHCIGTVFSSPNDVLSLRHFILRAMDDQDKLVSLERHIVFQHAVLRNSDTHQTRTHRTDSANDCRAFKAGNDPSHQRPRRQNRANPRDGECR